MTITQTSENMGNSFAIYMQRLKPLTGPITYGLTNDYMFRAVFQESEGD